MSERKVLNKYYPPDFDPSQIPRGKRNKNATFNIRIMAPFNMRCNMCKEYIYKGKKFNSRKEDVMDETYLGLRIFRFYIKCPRCVSEIAFKTDLEKTDYALEAGATRLFEAEKIAHQMAEQERKEREEDELNPMKVLENRTKASQQEMEQIDSLEELREINSKKNVVNTDEMIEKYRKYEEMLLKLQMEREEEEIKEIFGEKGTMVVKRLNDSDSEEEEPASKKPALGVGAKPTDILAQEDSMSSKMKKPAVWEKSVGSLSSNSRLKGLVVKKKANALGIIPMSQKKGTSQASKGNVSTTTSSNETGHATKDCVGDAADSSVEEDLDNADTKDGSVSLLNQKTENEGNVNTCESKTEDKIVSEIVKGKSDTVNNSESKDEKRQCEGVKTGPVGSDVVKPSGLGGLGLLGAYSDSESDASDS